MLKKVFMTTNTYRSLYNICCICVVRKISQLEFFTGHVSIIMVETLNQSFKQPDC